MGISAYSMVSLADGEQKRAEDLAAGDRVANPLTGNAVAVRKVWQGPGVGMIRITVADGTVFDATGDQRLLAGGAMTPAGQVRAGAPLRTVAGDVPCADASPLPGDYMVYDVVLEDDAGGAPCIAANGLIVGC